MGVIIPGNFKVVHDFTLNVFILMRFHCIGLINYDIILLHYGAPLQEEEGVNSGKPNQQEVQFQLPSASWRSQDLCLSLDWWQSSSFHHT